jgi:signal transduction histidine kinase
MRFDASPVSVVVVEAIVMAVLAAIFFAVGRRTREPGMACLTAGFLLAAAWYGLSDRIVYRAPDIDTLDQRIGAAVIGSSVMLVSIGVVQYLGMPRERLRPLVLVCWASAVGCILAVLATAAMPHRLFHFGVLAAYLGAAAVALRRASQRPGDGHVMLGLSLLSLPLTPVVMQAAGTPPHQLKYFAGLSVIVFGLILLTVSLLRRQRWLRVEVQRRSAAEVDLREANARLEARVQERTQHLHELIDGLEAFSRSVSHDLRGPLGGMSSLARLAGEALERGDDALARRSLPAIAKQCEASAAMVASMLELARLGETTAQRAPVYLTDLARSALDEVMLGRGDAVRPALSFGAMPLVMADERMLRAVFVNLLGNAVKFTRNAAAPRIEVQATVQGRDVVVSVSDNGVGFDAGVAERLFEPFYRAHDSRFEGHGLGLSIVRRAVEAMGGAVWAQGRTQGGASISFTLPGAFQAADARELPATSVEELPAAA